MKSLPTLSTIALLAILLCAVTVRADDPVTFMYGGIRGTVVIVKDKNLVQWTNNTLHKLNFTYTLTLDDKTTVNGKFTLKSKQTFQDTTTAQKLRTITKIKITHIDIAD